MRGNRHGPYFVKEVSGVPEVAGVDGGEWVEVVFQVMCDVVSGAVAV